MKNKAWFEYLPSARNPTESHYRCRLCFANYDKFHLNAQYKNALAYSAGQLKKTLEKNRDVIMEHGRSKSHLSVIEILQKQAQKRLRTDFEQIQQTEDSQDNKYLEITSRMIRTVYVINKLTMSFSSHGGMVLLQKANGIDMGYHHYERTSCFRMTELISKHMHQTLVDNIMKQNVPISLIVDGTTDSSRVHYLIVYFQTIENNNPMIYFYRLLEVHQETSEGLFNALTDAWKKESKDLYAYMKSNLIGFASDGAAVNVGKKGGLALHLKNFARNPIFAVHCMAHRLELAIQHSFEVEGAISNMGKNIDTLINSIYSFYNDKSHKRKTHLKTTAERLKVKFIELIYIFDVRWIASNYRAMKKINDMWKALTTDLNEISTSTDREFPPATKEKAKKLKDCLIGKNFLPLYHLLFDITYELDFWSIQLQKRSGLLIDFYTFKQRITSTFLLLKNENGRYLTLFLNNAKCSDNGDNLQACKTLEKYYQSSTVEYETFKMIDDSQRMPSLDEVRDNFLDSLIEELDSYFPDGNMQDFDIFRPSEMPNANDEVRVRIYGISEITDIAKYFGMNQETILNEWQTLLLTIVKSNNYCLIKKEEVESMDFWSQLLNWPDLAWGENIKKLIYTILAIPISSAEAERGFSSLKYIRNDHRTALSPNHLEDIMRIKLNGPDDIDKFAATKYAKKWINEGHLRTDDPQQKRDENSISKSIVRNDDKKNYMLFRSTIF